MKITDVTVTGVSGAYTGPVFPPGSRQSQPLDVYAEFNERSASGGTREAMRALYLEISSDEGRDGNLRPVPEIAGVRDPDVAEAFPRRAGSDGDGSAARSDDPTGSPRTKRSDHDGDQSGRLRALGSEGQNPRAACLPTAGRSDADRGAGLREHVLGFSIEPV